MSEVSNQMLWQPISFACEQARETRARPWPSLQKGCAIQKNLDQQPAVRSGSHKATDQGLRLISQFKNDLGVLSLLRGLAQIRQEMRFELILNSADVALRIVTPSAKFQANLCA